MQIVANAANAAIACGPLGSSFTATLTFTANYDGAWYGVVEDPGDGLYEISQVRRADGTEVASRNFWLRDRAIGESGSPIYGAKLHFFDVITTTGVQTYTITFEAKPTDVLAVLAFEGVVDDAVENDVRDGVTVVFSRAIDPATFTAGDLSLWKQGVHVSDLSAVTIMPADGTGTRFAIGNLSAICGDYGRYELTVQCAGIADTVGQLGTSGKSIAWTYSPSDAPYVASVDGVPSRRTKSVDLVLLTFSTPIDPTTITPNMLRLNGKEVGNGVTIEPLDDSGMRFAVSGLSAEQASDGEYTLTVDSSTLSGLGGKNGVDVYTATWTCDTAAPVLQSVSRSMEGITGNEFVITFSEPVARAAITLPRVVLRRDGNVVTLPSTASLRPVGSSGDDAFAAQYVLSGIDSVLTVDGKYELTFTSDGVTDEASNIAAGSMSTPTWNVDTTPPGQIPDFAISPDGGFADTDGITYTNVLTVSGTLPEVGLTAEIIAKYAGGGETILAVLATDAISSSRQFSHSITLSGSGNVTLVVRLTDADGNTSDTEKKVFVDGIALAVTLTGASEDQGVVTSTANLTFSDKVMDGDVTVGNFSLTRDGEVVALEGVSITKVDDTTFTLTGLDSLCAEDGAYALTFNGASVRKYSSGLMMGESLVMRWRYERPDRQPPTVKEVLFDGEAPHDAYSDVFSSVSVTFSETVNVPELIANGLIARAARIDLLDAAGIVTGCVAAVVGQPTYIWNAESNTLSWAINPNDVPVGMARLMLDAGLICDLSGNYLAADGYASTNGMRSYTASGVIIAQVNAYAMPMWYNGELYVGEKTADNKGKIRHYTADRLSWLYLQSESADIEIAAEGCQGASFALADMDGDGTEEIYVGTAGGDILKYPGGTVIVSLGAKRAMPYAYDMDGDGCDELVVGDMDGHIRIISRSHDDDNISTALLNDVNGAPLIVPNGRAAPVVADINHDGMPDILSTLS